MGFVVITKLEVENFYSVQNRQVLDLTVPRNAPAEAEHLVETWAGSRERVPKIVAIFGANGSGKSNVLRALSFIPYFAEHSFSFPVSNALPFQPYNDDEFLERPTRLKLWFSGPDFPITQAGQDCGCCMYCYELEVSNGKMKRVRREAMYFWPPESGRRTRLFERFEDGTVKASRTFDLGPEKTLLQRILKPNASVISTLAHLNHPFSNAIAHMAGSVKSNILVMKDDWSDRSVLEEYMERPELVEQLNQEINRVDVGVRRFDVSPFTDGGDAFLHHEGLNPIPFRLESHGTRQFIKHFLHLHQALSSGGVAVIDELDMATHPLVMGEILRWFRDPERNPHNAQLWMSCQSPSLLEELQKDEIIFCEKDPVGRTEIFSLNDVKAVRRDDNFYRKYMGGHYGALPLIG